MHALTRDPPDFLETPDAIARLTLDSEPIYQSCSFTPLHLAAMQPTETVEICRSRYTCIPSLFCSKLSREMAAQPIPQGLTALDLALLRLNRIAIQSLVESGATLIPRSAKDIDTMITGVISMQLHVSQIRSQITHSLSCCKYLIQKISALHGFAKTLHRQDCIIFSEELQKVIYVANELHTQDQDGYTLLHVAARAGDAASTALLLDRGARCDLLNRNGMRPIDLAAIYGHTAVYLTLKARGEPLSQMVASSLFLYRTSAQIAEDVLAQQGPIQDYSTLLQKASRANSVAMVFFLLSRGADIRLLFDSSSARFFENYDSQVQRRG